MNTASPRSALAAFLVALSLVPMLPSRFASGAPAGQAPGVYIGSESPISHIAKARNHAGNAALEAPLPGPDYMDQFLPGSPGWARLKPYVRAFQLSQQFINHSSPDQLAQIVSSLRGVPIAVASEGLPKPPESAGCGQHMPGYSPPGTLVKALARLRDAGGSAAYVTWDNPLFLGGVFTGSPNRPGAVGCQTPIPELAAQLSQTASAALSVFPEIRFLEFLTLSGAPGKMDLDTYPRQVAAWVQAERAQILAKGRTLLPEVYIADSNGDWPISVPLSRAVHGVIRAGGGQLIEDCNGGAQARSEAIWAESARRNCAAFNRITDAGTSPWIAVVSWNTQPAWGPESDPDSIMGLAHGFLRERGIDTGVR